jgi:antitoxin FitA
MASVLVRHLNEDVMERLKKRAREHGRSLQSEAKTILEEAVPNYEGAWKRIERFRKRLQQSGRTFNDSAALIRDDRDR